MSATLTPPPVQAGPARGSAPARRAIRRWAWRLLRREWRQQLLILLLLLVAVAATTVGLGVVVNLQGTDQALAGTANTRIDIGNLTGNAAVSADLAAARQRFGTVEAIAHQSVSVPGAITAIDLRAEQPHGVFSAPMLHLVSGAYPTGPDQLAVTSGVAALLQLRVGQTWAAAGHRWQVVGMVENPKDLTDGFGLLAVGQLPKPDSVSLLLNTSTLQHLHLDPPAGAVQDVVATGVNAAQERRNQAIAVLVLATIGLTFIGLLSVAGFTVLAQRRLRSLGMIAAVGASDRQVRRVMLASGAAVGLVGSGLGVATGLAAWFALTPAVQSAVGHRYDPLQLPWWAVIVAAALAVVTAVAASWWPARAVARLPIVVALSGRPAPPQPAHRFALLGVALSAGGFLALVLANARQPVLIVVGILASTAGMLLLTPLAIALLARPAGRVPVASRLALRDIARYQARSGAALAAASLAVGIAATVAVSAAAQQAHDSTLKSGNLPADQLIVWLTDPNQSDHGGGLRVAPAGGLTRRPTLPSAAVVATGRSRAEAIAARLGGGSVLELDAAADLNVELPAGAPPGAGNAVLVRPLPAPDGGQGWSERARPEVATDAVLKFYGLSPAQLAGADVVTSRPDLQGVQLGSGVRGSFRLVTVQVLRKLPGYTSAPNTLITPKAMTEFGLTADPVGWLVQAKHPLTPAELGTARADAAASGLAIESRAGPRQTLQHVRDYATVAGMLGALGVLAMTIGLIRSETAADLRTLTATGAGPVTRRSLNATSAGVLALLGGVLGTAAAYLALIAWHWRNLAYVNQPPWLNLGLLVLGLPVLAAAGGWLVGRPPRSIARRPSE